MVKGISVIKIALVILLGIFIQVFAIFADCQDNPAKAAVEFARAYFAFDPAMANRLCGDSLVVDEVNTVSAYLAKAEKESAETGFRYSFLKNKLYEVRTYTLEKDFEKAKIRLTAEKTLALRSFFTREAPEEIDVVMDLVWEKGENETEGKWKVCGDLESIFSS